MRRRFNKVRKSSKVGDFIIAGIALVFLLTGILIFWASSLQVPDLNSFNERRVSQSAKIYDRTGEVLLYNLGENTKRTLISGEKISRNIKNASVAIEDAEFYQHNGIRISSIIRAIFINTLSFGFSQGGSTITQQVVKNSLLTSEKKISRKIKEWILSVKLEQIASKEQILEIYLNESPYGGTIYGVEEASLAFFGKHAEETSLGEAAYLAAIPQAPTYYSPYGNHKEALDKRKDLVLSKMLDNKFITKDEFEKAKNEKVAFLPQGDTSIKAPHFVFWVREYLEQKYGRESLENDGLKITTTIDFKTQSKAEEIVKKFALENKIKFNAENAAIVAIDPKTGQILTLVGSRDYFDKNIDGNFNVAIAKRQPGSAFKPFVYATAFKKGYTPDTVLFDLKTQFSTFCEPWNFSKESPCFSPDNYDNVFRGPVSLRDALAQSMNVPSVKTLYLAGIKDSLETSKDMGITTLEDKDRYGLTLVLGGGEVTLLDLVSAYGVFGNDGVRNSYTSILKVENGRGEILEEFNPSPRSVLDSNIARTISAVLSDNKARSPAFGESSYLYFPNREVAAKTGTTNDYKDAWIVGYTPSIAVGAWAGNNDNSPMEKKVAGFIVAPMWNAFMKDALESLPNEPLPKADQTDKTKIRPILRGLWQGGVVYVIDKFSGNLATTLTPNDAREERAVKNIHSILYWVDKNNPNGEIPPNPSDDPQFKLWEYPVRLWVHEKNIKEEGEEVIPTQNDTLHNGSGPNLSISGIKPEDTFSSSEKITPIVTSSGQYPIEKVDFYLNEYFLGSSKNDPFSLSFTAKDNSEKLEYSNNLRVVAYDSILNKTELIVPFFIKNNEEQVF